MKLFRRTPRPGRELTDWEREALTTGLAGFCKHGVGMLDNCPRCCPPRSPAELPTDRPVVDVEAVELAERLLKERDEATNELARVRKRYDQAQLELLNAGTLAQRLEARVAKLETENEALRGRPLDDVGLRWKRQAEQDRRNAVVLEDRLAVAEGRPVRAVADLRPKSTWGSR